jgi:AbrB family looped-hinge helix DNA binding protein
MKETDILRIDARGRIVIPRTMRKTLGILENSQLMVICDPDSHELKIIPLPFDQSHAFIKIRILLSDEVGALARVANVFSDLNMSLIYGETVVVKKGIDAEWSVISPAPPCPMEEFKRLLLEGGGAKQIHIEEPRPAKRADDASDASPEEQDDST